MERPKVDANIATGLDLDQWALHVGTMPRRPGETDETLRKRVLHAAAYRWPGNGKTEAERSSDPALRAVAVEIVERWKQERGMPYLSANACLSLAGKIEAALGAVDYKTLLWKYLNHVGVEESVTYVARPSAKHRFTERELAALYEIEDMPRPEGPEWK